MKTTKMSLASIQGKLSRSEMKNIMAGSGGGGCCGSDRDCGGNASYCNKAYSCDCGHGAGAGCCTP